MPDLYQLANNNAVGYRDIYPTSLGVDSSTAATGAAPSPGGAVAPVGDAAGPMVNIAPQGIIAGGIAFLALIFLLMFAARRLGETDDFRAIKPSVYNVVIMGMAAAAGLPLIKYSVWKVASVFPLAKPVAAWVLAA
jgi:hypothetical protein